jgi:hypothetical protein
MARLYVREERVDGIMDLPYESGRLTCDMARSHFEIALDKSRGLVRRFV